MKLFSIKILIVFILVILLNSCYEDYIIISSDFKECKISKDSSQVFFFHSLQAAQPPKEESRFPDGGQHKIIYKNLSLYSFYLDKNELVKIYDFGNIPFNNTLEHISLQDNLISFSVSPLMGWNWIKKHSSDSTYKNIKNKYRKFYTYNLADKSLQHIKTDGFYPNLSPDQSQIVYLKRDSTQIEIWNLHRLENNNKLLKTIKDDSPFISMKWKDQENIYYKSDDRIYLLNLNSGQTINPNIKVNLRENTISIKFLKELTKDISFQTWGFDINNHWARNKKEYTQDIVHLHGNFNYRKAILQTQAFCKNELLNILEEMKKYANSLEGYKKTEYELYSKETIELINQYLD